MIYLIGGAPRSGKTQVQKYLLNNYKISGVSTDVLRAGFYTMPEIGINEAVGDAERSVRIWPFIKGIINSQEYYHDDLVIEGANLLPEYLSEVKDDKNVRMCFVGYRDPKLKIENIRNNPNEPIWNTELNDEELLKRVTGFQVRSQQFEVDCKKYGIKYFETSDNFFGTIKEAAEYLIKI